MNLVHAVSWIVGVAMVLSILVLAFMRGSFLDEEPDWSEPEELTGEQQAKEAETDELKKILGIGAYYVPEE
jgi:hypothetical protein